ncbi:DddA-like double-stranded DNA deaminase toxin [Longispora urticae]
MARAGPVDPLHKPPQRGGPTDEVSKPARERKPHPNSPPPEFDQSKAALVEPSRGHTKTIGVLFNRLGKMISGPLWSGEKGPAEGGPGIREDGRWRQLSSLVEHSEGHAAAIMRRDGIMDAVIYLNRPPCPGPLGCQTNIGHVLPGGARLTAYYVKPSGAVEQYIFRGTGKALNE